MREIKFRAWDKTRKMLAPPCTLQDWVFSMAHSCREELIDEFFSEHIFMQHTGLKDKNSVEIYEGDIVISRDESLVVVWVDCTARFALKSPDYEAEWSVDNGRCRVIGNIYENPELSQSG